ncbi:transposase [Candidatus Nitrospira nitrosa]|uniref:Transposase n=1 Tax=Candidatus Nitrospira nitrosa TaxID=1742972 RepID=A0A0S4LQI6_9BACT|nr:transposase [Candidatus Nitrospira nitrosa]
MICASLWLEVVMSDMVLLSRQQVNRITPYFPVPHGIPRVDDLRVISGIIYGIRHGLQWKDAPKAYGPHKTLYNRFVRWSRVGIFHKIFRELSRQSGTRDCLMIDATHLKAHRTAASLLRRGQSPAVLAA